MSKKDEIINTFKERINNNTWKPGDKLPAEVDLAKTFNVSRSTLRLALSELEHSGLVERILGSGTFIKDANYKKYIIIAVPDIFSENNFYWSYNYIAQKLKTYARDKGFKTFVYFINKDISFFNTVKIPPYDIEGWVNINLDFKVQELLTSDVLSKKIPVINALSLDTAQYNVTIDIYDMAKKIDYLLKKYNLKKALVFNSFDDENIEIHRLTFYNYGLDYYFSQKYKTVKVKGKYTTEERKQVIIDNLLKYKDIVDTFVFTDDTMFKSALSVLYDHNLFSKKIITHTNYPNDISYPQNICMLQFDLDVLAENIIGLLQKIINKEYIDIANIYLPVKIINEEILK